MTKALPPPMLPASVDLRAFPDLPLGVARLQKSETLRRITPEEFRAAIRLWCSAWHETPAASLPDDDVTLADLAGYGNQVKVWKKVRTGALRGFVLCSDGRFYHPVIVEKAVKAWRAQLDSRFDRERGRIKKAAQRDNTRPVYPEFEQWITRACPEFTPFLSPGKSEPVPVDTAEDSPGQSPGTPPPCPPVFSDNRTEQNRTTTTTASVKTVEKADTRDPAPAAKAVGGNPTNPNPHAVLVAELRAECKRAKVMGKSSDLLVLQRWAESGITTAIVAKALALARAPGAKPAPEELRIGYVDTIVVRLAEEAKAQHAQAEARVDRTLEANAELRNAPTAPMPESVRKTVDKVHRAAHRPAAPQPEAELEEDAEPITEIPWWVTPAGVMRRAPEVNVHASEDEDYPTFAARVAAASGPGPWDAEMAPEVRELIPQFRASA